MQTHHLFIPGEAEAIAEERELRNEPYLSEQGAPRSICGILVNQITPLIHARLVAVKSPFLGGSDVTPRDVMIFLWVCSPEFRPDLSAQKSFFAGLMPCFRWFKKSLGLDFEEAAAQIDAFMDNTYMDAPKSHKRSKPYYSLNASIEFTMGSEPFFWDYETKTQHVPLRRIFQLMNVKRHHKGGIIDNPLSDKCVQDHLERINNDPDMRAFFELHRISQTESNPDTHGEN